MVYSYPSNQQVRIKIALRKFLCDSQTNLILSAQPNPLNAAGADFGDGTFHRFCPAWLNSRLLIAQRASITIYINTICNFFINVKEISPV
jgi:hypothetical protein